jgi:NTP pyrophosphatase (non-canonical NTP hydrolase)
MSIHFNELRPDELERLAILAEECGEVIQAVGKILRHGYASTNPMYPDLDTNRQQLVKEVGDVMVAIDFMLRAGDIAEGDMEDRMRVKKHRIQDYLHHQG